MAIKKRPRPKPVRPNPAAARRRKHEKHCIDLYNRLQADYDDPIFDAMQEVSHILGLQVDVTWTTDQLIETMLARTTTTIQTWQWFSDKDRMIEVHMRYLDSKRQRHKIVTIRSHRLALAVTLAYVQLCKQTGKFI